MIQWKMRVGGGGIMTDKYVQYERRLVEVIIISPLPPLPFQLRKEILHLKNNLLVSKFSAIKFSL